LTHRPPTIAFYYGSGNLEILSHYERVVLQPGQYTSAELEWLRSQGVVTLAYLSLSEDAGPAAPWHKGPRNPDWGTAYVTPSHPLWLASRLESAATNLRAGFGGLFLDTLDLADLYPADRAGILALIKHLRQANSSSYLLANRGFSLLPELANLVDGLVFEAFSTAWTEGKNVCRILSLHELKTNSSLVQQLKAYDLELYALDYVSRRIHHEFARRRAARYGLSWFASNRSVTQLPQNV
jgi:polysaccharide biosynthesis protein PelA